MDHGILFDRRLGTRHDKALEAYEATQACYSQERTKLLDWTNREKKVHAKQNALGYAAFRFL